MSLCVSVLLKLMNAVSGRCAVGSARVVPGRCAVNAAFLCTFLLLLAGCGSSADPESWEEAEAAGSVRQNFMNACMEGIELAANSGASGGEAEVLAVSVGEEYCGCVFDRYRNDWEYDEFRALDSALRLNPDPSDLDSQDVDPSVAVSWEKSQNIMSNCARKSET